MRILQKQYPATSLTTKLGGDHLLKGAGEKGASLITQKFEIAKTYLRDSWNIDINQLRATVLRRCNEIPELDLETL